MLLCFGSGNFRSSFVLVVLELKLENAVLITCLICIGDKRLISVPSYCALHRSRLLGDTKSIHFSSIDLSCSSAVKKSSSHFG